MAVPTKRERVTLVKVVNLCRLELASVILMRITQKQNKKVKDKDSRRDKYDRDHLTPGKMMTKARKRVMKTI